MGKAKPGADSKPKGAELYELRARLVKAHAVLKSKKYHTARKATRWMSKWCATEEAKRHLLQFIYSDDEWLAFAATQLIYAYGVGKPSQRREEIDESKGVQVDWRKYEGEEGPRKLLEDFKAEVSRHQTVKRLAIEVEPDRSA